MHEPTEAALLDDLQTSVAELLTDVSNLTPFVAALTDTHQRGLGFLTYEGKQAQGRAYRAEQRAGAERRKDGYDLGPGESPSPGNIAGLSVYAEIHTTLHFLVRYLIKDLAKRGVCTLTQVPKDPEIDDLVTTLRALTWQAIAMPPLEAVRRDLEQLRETARQLIDGNDRTVLGADCPHCGNRTLVVYFADGLIRCDRHPKTGRYEPCTCPDPLCDCKVRPRAFRHEWHRAKGTKPNSWWSLSDRLNLDRTTEKEPQR